MRTFAAALFFSFALIAGSLSVAPSASAQANVLCFRDIDCPDDTTCKELGTQAGGRGVCRGPGLESAANGTIDNPLAADSLQDLLLALMRGVVRIGAIGLLVFLVYVGFTFVAAQGNEEKLRTARTSLIWTVVGGAILLGAEAIMDIIQATANSFAP